MKVEKSTPQVIDKAAISKEFAKILDHAFAVRDLLDSLHNDQFNWTKEGARKQYYTLCGENEAKCALGWMDDRYDTIEAAIRAATLISEIMCDAISPFRDTIIELISEATDMDSGESSEGSKEKETVVRKIIDPETGTVVRLAQDAKDLESCLKKIQGGDLPMIVQIGDGDRSLQVIPR